MKIDRQSTIEKIGAELPVKLSDGWTFDGSCVLEGEDGPFLLARWKREVGNARKSQSEVTGLDA